MKVLGIDPGSRMTGFGVVEKRGGVLLSVDCGCFRPKGNPPLGQIALPERLSEIYRLLVETMQKFAPDAVALEEVFFAKNVASALKLGEARGVALLAASQCHLPLFEYSPAEIKQALTGYGQAGKEQIQKMVQKILNLPEMAEENASDALAVAICHLNTNQTLARAG